MLYTVTWGDETKDVYAENEGDAWSEFAKGHDLAMRCPQLYTRTIEIAAEADNADFPDG
jgi:hypothetical protein